MRLYDTSHDHFMTFIMIGQFVLTVNQNHDLVGREYTLTNHDKGGIVVM